jgi:hypothetical protein
VNAPARQWHAGAGAETPPGQPEVTRFRKASGHRTLIVSLLSLAWSSPWHPVAIVFSAP